MILLLERGRTTPLSALLGSQAKVNLLVPLVRGLPRRNVNDKERFGGKPSFVSRKRTFDLVSMAYLEKFRRTSQGERHEAFPASFLRPRSNTYCKAS